MKWYSNGLVLIVAVLLSCRIFSQTNTYILNGNATQNTCNCYTLTQPLEFQNGSVWNASKIDLRTSFNFIFNVYLGCKDVDGADGIVFMLQPISTSIGTSGGGMGFSGVVPSIGIALDTWQNTDFNDPVYDHISIQANGNVNHGSDLAGPVPVSGTTDNIEDCQWHTLRIIWDAATFKMDIYFDDRFRLSHVQDLVTTIFNNDPMVYWGFSGATGGSVNLQQFCTALNPVMVGNPANYVVCLGNAITLQSQSQSFAPIATYFWDFGDGFTSTQMNPPAHLFNTAGFHNVKMAITGFDGCKSDTLVKTIAVGDYPQADFTIVDTCAGIAPRINDLSTVDVGDVATWDWVLDGAAASGIASPQFNGLPAGPHTLQLDVASNYGCASTVVQKAFTMKPTPLISADALDGCINEPVSFNARQLDNTTTISSWHWNFGDGSGQSADPSAVYSYTRSANYPVTIQATATNGCSSNTVSIPLFINQAIADAGNDTLIVKNVPLQLHGQGGIHYSWLPASGLDDPFSANPVAVLADDVQYILTVTTAEGCIDEDTVNVTVFKGSNIFVPTGFTPNNDGLNDVLRPYYVGIKSIDYFMLYNRWGQVVYSTGNLNGGWDGRLGNMPQSTGVYIWRLRATDFIGKVYELKGTTTLIRR